MVDYNKFQTSLEQFKTKLSSLPCDSSAFSKSVLQIQIFMEKVLSPSKNLLTIATAPQFQLQSILQKNKDSFTVILSNPITDDVSYQSALALKEFLNALDNDQIQEITNKLNIIYKSSINFSSLLNELQPRLLNAIKMYERHLASKKIGSFILERYKFKKWDILLSELSENARLYRWDTLLSELSQNAKLHRDQVMASTQTNELDRAQNDFIGIQNKYFQSEGIFSRSIPEVTCGSSILAVIYACLAVITWGCFSYESESDFLIKLKRQADLCTNDYTNEEHYNELNQLIDQRTQDYPNQKLSKTLGEYKREIHNAHPNEKIRGQVYAPVT